LERILSTFDRNLKHSSARETYLSQFSASKVAAMFQKNLVEPALSEGAAREMARLPGWLDIRYKAKEKAARMRKKLYRVF
jgi:hypothetical protein